ncbi:MAG: type II 3-dehydroquinate dehydratase [Rubrobacteraceae bacterium]
MGKVFILNGVNLGSLGERRPEIYGRQTLADIEKYLRKEYPDTDLEFRQTDYEGEFVGWIHEAREAEGLIVNPGAWTHYSYAIHDALEAVPAPKVEVHLSNVHGREEWRRTSVISPAVDSVVAGMGAEGYRVALDYVLSNGKD